MNEEILISFLEPNAERYYIVDGEKPKHINVKTVLITSPCLEISKVATDLSPFSVECKDVLFIAG